MPLYHYLTKYFVIKDFGVLNCSFPAKATAILIFAGLLTFGSCKTCKCPAYSYDAKPKRTAETEGFAIVGERVEEDGDWWGLVEIYGKWLIVKPGD